MPKQTGGNDVEGEPRSQSPVDAPGQPPGNQNPPSPPANQNPDSANDQPNEFEKDIRIAEYWLIGVGVAAVIVNILIATIYYGQLQQMREATQATTEALKLAQESSVTADSNFDREMMQTIHQTAAQLQSSDAAMKSFKQSQKALQATIDNFHLEQRPWLGIKSIECDRCWAGHDLTVTGDHYPNGFPRFPASISTWGLGAFIVNTGKTPAEEIQVDFTIHQGWMMQFPYSLPNACTDPKSTAPCLFPQYDPTYFVESGKYPNKMFSISPSHIGDAIPDDPIKIMFNPQQTTSIFPLPAPEDLPDVYVDGVITYKDVWGNSGETKFCIFPAPRHFSANNKNYEYCDKPGSNTMR
jgi:hypothetical protein